MEPSWIVRTYREGDENEILEVLGAAFENWGGIERWNWTFKDNADGFFSDLILLADDNGKFAGHYTIIPARMKIGDEVVLGSQSVDTATHPDYRRQGIFEKLAKETYANAANHGIKVTYGFAKVGPSYHGFVKKLDWHHICFLVEHELIIDSEKAVRRHFEGRMPGFIIKIISKFLAMRNRRKTNVKIPKDVSVREVQQFDERIDGFWKTASKEYDIMIYKDQKFFNWRLKSPGHSYVIFIVESAQTMQGYLILVEGREDCRIADILALPDHDEEINYLISKAIKYCKEQRKDMLRCSLPKNHKYTKTLKRMGFFSTETEMGFIVRINIPDAQLEEKLKSLKNWYITDLDSDHV